MLARYISLKIARCLRSSIPSYSFCTLPKISFTEFTRVYRRPVSTDEFEYIIEDEAKKVSFTISDDATIADLKQKFQEQSSDIKDVKALSLDLAEMANTTQLHELSDETYYMILNNQSLCKMVSLERSEAEIAERAYKKREETCQNAGLPFIEQQIILNYLQRVDILNAETLGNRLFADTRVHEGKVDKKVIIKNLFDGAMHQKNHTISNEPELIANYLELRNQLEAMKIQHELLEARAHSATKWKMTLGLFLLFGQFSFVGIGTYVVYSWDIMEPMAYFLGLFGSIALSAMYFRIESDYSNFQFLRHMRQRELEKLYRKTGFPIEEMRGLEETIKMLEKKIKSNILIDL